MRLKVVYCALATALAFAGCSIEGEQLPGPNGAGANSSSGTAGGGGGVGNMGAAPTDCPECIEDETGVGTNNPFDPENNPSSGVGLDPDGALVLDKSNTDLPHVIWIANTNSATVTKVDTQTHQIQGRYRIGTSDPSRTSVNSQGDVFVGNRSGNSLTKVSSAGQSCPDTNNDGQTTTSTGFNDVLNWGQDDCVLWDVAVPGGPRVRGVAAQDLVVPDPLPDFPDHTTVEHYVWVGGTNHRTAYKFDGETGALLIQTPAPTGIYGLAVDDQGQLWMSGNTDGKVIGRIDTNKCADQASCDAAEICTRDCTSGTCACTSCSTSCDDAIKERIELPSAVYGITVDFKQRVWTGGSYVQRYNPGAAQGQKYAAVSGTGFTHGIAADANGWVWGACGSSGVARINGDTLAMTHVPVGSAKGMAVDREGDIWTVELGANAHEITPGASNTLNDYTMTPNAVTGLGQCYTYSDMTGMQLALATDEPGYYRETFEGCQQGTEWYSLDWEVETPTGTLVSFMARSAIQPEELDAAPWVVLAKIPPDNPPKSIANAFMAAGVPMYRYLEVEVGLQGSVTTNGLVSPRVLSFAVSHHCPPVAN